MAENHIIPVEYSPTGYTKTRPAYQYDYGQELDFRGFGDLLPATFEVHFSIGRGEAVTQIGTNGKVTVPDACFLRYGTTTAWLFLHDSEADGETKYVIETPVKSKAYPTDDPPTPVEQSVVTQAIAALTAGVTAAEAAQAGAETAKTAAETARDEAVSAKNAAVQAKTSAESSASSASASASSASQSATAAGNSATDANSSREFADQSATAAQVAQEKAEEAQAKAETAQGKAETAQGKAETAQTGAESSASTATQKAQEATASATSASQSATAATTAKTAAETAKADAVSAKNDAQTAASSAAGSATSASGSATAASQSATAAAQSAQALSSFIDDTAGVGDSTKVWSADKSATERNSLMSAITNLEPRVDSLEINKADVIISSASGSIASFPDGADGMPVKELTIGIEPVQDLHGYNSPWPGGGGKNLFDINNPILTAYDANYFNVWSPKIEDEKFYNGGKIGSAAGVSYTVPVEESETYTVQFVINGEEANWEINAVTLNGNVWETRVLLASSNKISTGAVTATVTIPSGKTHLFVACYSATQYGSWETDIQIEKGSTATAWSPYSNLCPITGWTGANVTRAGKNLIDSNEAFGNYNNYTVNSDGSITVKAGDTRSWAAIPTIPLKAGTYILSRDIVNGMSAIRTSDNDYASDVKYILPNQTSNGSFTLVSDGGIKIKASYSGTYPATFKFQLEVGSAVTAYEPGNVQTITIPLGQTVYGGSLTVNEDGTGKVVVDRIEWTAPRTGWQTYQHSTGTTIKYYNLPSETIDVIPNAVQNRFYSISDTFAYYTNNANWYSEMPDCQYVYNVSGVSMAKRVWISYEGDNFEGIVEGAKFIFMLQTPLTYNLTALDVLETLKGTNNIWASTGDTTVTYRADTKLYIDNRITQAIAAALNA